MWKDIKYYTPGPDNKICHGSQGHLQVKSKGECLTKLKAKAETLAQNQKLFGTFIRGSAHRRGDVYSCRYGIGSSRAHAEDKCNAKPTQSWPWCGKTASSAGPIQCANIRFSGAPVSVYEHANKGGWEATFGVGNYSFHAFLAAGAKNDRMSSIRVSKGYIATLFQHGSFNGWSQEFKEGVYNLPYGSARNDDASSIKVRRVKMGPRSEKDRYDKETATHNSFIKNLQNNIKSISSDMSAKLASGKNQHHAGIASLSKNSRDMIRNKESSHNTQKNNMNTQYSNLIKAKATLQKKFDYLNADLKRKIAKISELAA